MLLLSSTPLLLQLGASPRNIPNILPRGVAPHILVEHELDRLVIFMLTANVRQIGTIKV